MINKESYIASIAQREEKKKKTTTQNIIVYVCTINHHIINIIYFQFAGLGTRLVFIYTSSNSSSEYNIKSSSSSAVKGIASSSIGKYNILGCGL